MNFAVVGHPIKHSLSPAMHNWVFDRLQLEAGYRSIQADSGELSDTIAMLRRGELDGLNVTLPHKQKVTPLLDNLSMEAKDIGAVNCIVRDGGRLVGHNTDWYGFTMALQRNDIDVRGRSCVVLGAGGMARSALYSLIRRRASTIFVANRTPKKAEFLVASLAQIGEPVTLWAIPLDNARKTLPENALVVNCTPVGMMPDGKTSPLSATVIRKHHILMDAVYRPLETQFLRNGREAGAKTVEGLDMFIYQGLASVDLWLNDEVSQRVNVNDLKAYLTEQLQMADGP